MSMQAKGIKICKLKIRSNCWFVVYFFLNGLNEKQRSAKYRRKYPATTQCTSIVEAQMKQTLLECVVQYQS